MAKTFMRRSKCDKSTLHKIDVIMRRGCYRKPRRSNTTKNWRTA
jgi:hypothetical protein